MKIKKYIPLIMTFCAAAAVCAGCTTKGADNKEYDELNSKLQFNYSQIVLSVTNEIDEDTTLTSEYTMNFSDEGVTVTYRVETLPELSLDSVAGEKQTLTGEAKITGKTVTYVSGDEAPLDSLTAGKGLNFKSEYFAHADLTDTHFIADVVNPGGFMGAQLKCTGMKVNASFLSVFSEISITYTGQKGNRVEYLYTFSGSPEQSDS